MLTSHDKPSLIVLDGERCRRLLSGAEHLAQLVMASNLVEAARAISAADPRVRHLRATLPQAITDRITWLCHLSCQTYDILALPRLIIGAKILFVVMNMLSGEKNGRL